MYEQTMIDIKFMELDVLRVRRESLFDYIPEETYEDFLNWLNK